MDASLYTRPNKPKFVTVKKRRGQHAPTFDPIPEPVEVDAATECHVTPEAVGERMAQYLKIDGCCKTLEPSAGTGNLIKAVLEWAPDLPPIVAVERHHSLIDTMSKRFEGEDIRYHQQCFLEYASETSQRFHRIIMNPPFKQIKKHMAAAIRLLADEDAVLVALVPITYQHDEAETLEELGSDTFASAKVNTKIIIIER